MVINLDPAIGHEIQKTRPVLVVSNNINNKFNATISVLPITSNVKNVFSFEVFIPKNKTLLTKDSKVKADQIRTIDVSRLIKFIGDVPNHLMKEVNIALQLHLSL
ncbi:MAG: type II toxin-antitoxin system PemK/MazF family toxin [Bacteroidetes bacterium]|nr:type II toxin-antitoxin system PemK/MazF family toxin [Bacteroidota bacterium]MBK8671493.1 type II toxin-antitoxin system PemK/MazF family toxin [Bacteroidota bacterium]MBK9353067.1 type II toxin-antitoxin system PemK/MazF family toxin [Bacteroidota bacterium]MBK9633079.1 type II toxin-antitoxin system PemK/MazF family toxin [Bacteroidota bacterium]MBL0077537.1 type II toxin-antitoxin system PemK/MazF family toxin [Bacteroidota bacterium]